MAGRVETKHERDMKRLGILLLVLFAVGCDSADDDPMIRGKYIGTMTQSGTIINVVVTLSESGSGAVTGAGTVGFLGEAFATTVSGTHAYPDVALTFSTSEFTDFAFAGTTSSSGHELSGTVNGSGLFDLTLVLSR